VLNLGAHLSNVSGFHHAITHSRDNFLEFGSQITLMDMQRTVRLTGGYADLF
jgi:hypothetical protein